MTTDESQANTDESQKSHWQQQMNHRRTAVESQLTQTTEVHFQPLTWFNRFICRLSDICYHAI